ncbi:MAG: dihydroorotate dehydrogenase electron transfer subunit [Clostridia bacterium]|nr:dihydroorotate dehydrogenase electron transfer subunit [Clostridia bacterium]MDE7215794.1 dihydroorotate dehydrogenase electron transfer subunit [Clostridia bacterium]
MSELKDRLGEIIVNERVAKDIYRLEVAFDSLPENIKGAQFAHVKLNDKSHILRRPFCICDFDRVKKSITMCYAVVGEGTKILSQYAAGEKIKVLLPLGNGFVPDKSYKRIVLLGGGMGSAVLPAIPTCNPELEYYTYLGFANKDKVVLEKELAKVSKAIKVATDDGSYGEKGFVTDILAKDMEKLKPDAVFCCGPEVMYKALKKALQGFDVPIIVSLEARMGCGIGACLVCNCKVLRKGVEEYARVCVDGPVFKLDEVVL